MDLGIRKGHLYGDITFGFATPSNSVKLTTLFSTGGSF